MGALCSQKHDVQTNMKSILILYVLGTFLAAFVGVMGSFIFPVDLKLAANTASVVPPNGIVEVLRTLLLNLVDNPVHALMTGNYLGILFWSAIFGVALRQHLVIFNQVRVPARLKQCMRVNLKIVVFIRP